VEDISPKKKLIISREQDLKRQINLTSIHHGYIIISSK